MTFANPTAFWGLLLGIPIILFYFLKVRMRRVPVSTVMFWEQVFEEKNPRSLWKRLRHVSSLIFQLVTLLMCVLALSDPRSANDADQQRRVVAVVDNSASMQVIENGKTRLQIAKERLAKTIQALRSRDEMAIVSVNSQARVECGLTSQSRNQRKAADQIMPGDCGSNLAEGIRLAQRLAAGDERTEIVVLTDDAAEAKSAAEQDRRIKVDAIGESANNVAITQFEVRKTLGDSTGYELLIEVNNFANRETACRIDLTFNGELQDVIPLKLEPMGVWSNVLDGTSSEGGVFAASLNVVGRNANRLAADDHVLAVLPQPQQLSVTLVTQGNWFLEHVLQANDIVRLTVTDQPPQQTDDIDLLVLHRRVPDPLPPVATLVVQPETSSSLWEIDGVLSQPLAGYHKEDSIFLRHVGLQNVLMPQAVKISPMGNHERLVDSIEGDPLYVQFPRAGGDVMVLCVDLDQSDLPLRTAFPIVVANLISSLAGSTDFQSSVASGRNMTLPRLANSITEDDNNESELLLTGPDGRTEFVHVHENEVRIGPLKKCGLWSLSVASEVDSPESGNSTVLPIACNLSNPVESNLLRSNVATNSDVNLTTTSGGRPYWFFIVVVVLVVVVTEWSLFHRRRIA